jgi:hypothetical protein
MTDERATGTGTWVVLPTYEEAENLPGIAAAILAALPDATLLIVDDNSPDGTGLLAEALSAKDRRVHVLRRPGKLGLGTATLGTQLVQVALAVFAGLLVFLGSALILRVEEAELLRRAVIGRFGR